jgi:hypothetical protein
MRRVKGYNVANDSGWNGKDIVNIVANRMK